MASRKQRTALKSRPSGPITNVLKSNVRTPSSKRVHKTKPKSKPMRPVLRQKYSKPKQPDSFCDAICYYRNYFIACCLCIWILSVMIFAINNYYSKNYINIPNIHITPSNQDNNKLKINADEPLWMHALQPWEILPRPPKGSPPPMKCEWKGPFDGFLAGCGTDNCRNHNSFDSAKEACIKDELCTGLVKVIKDKEIYQLRSGGQVSESPSGESSFTKSCEVDQDKLDEMHQQEMNKLAGKEDKDDKSDKNDKDVPKTRNQGKDNQDLVNRIAAKQQQRKLMPQIQSNNNDIVRPDMIKQNIENHQNDIDILDNDPWSKFIPEMAKQLKLDEMSRSQDNADGDDNSDNGLLKPFDNGLIVGSVINNNDDISIEEKELELKKELLDPSSGCFLEGPISGFIANCASDNCENHQDLDSAIDKCLEEKTCTGVVQIVSGQNIYQLRSEKKLRDSPRGEVTWVKLCDKKALNRIHEIALQTPPPTCFMKGPFKGFLGNCAGKECRRFYYFNDALVECENMGSSECRGITRIPGLKKSFELRAIAPVIGSESGEYSYLMECGDSDNGDDDIDIDYSDTYDPMSDDPIIEEYEKIGKIIEVEDHHTNEMVLLPTIFIGIASYRDPWCFKSVHTAFARARYPERVFVGVVQQNAEIDPECITPEIPCDEDPTQVLCKYVSHIRVTKFHARDAAGPTFGRHYADKLYDGEYFAVQIDAHMSFVKDWDMIVIEQWSSLDNEYAILTTYPSEIRSGMDEYGNPLTESAPIICNTRLLHNGMFKHEAAGEIKFPESHKDKPMLSPFLGAGVMFSRGHRIVRVPYDCCLPMIFDGEEFTMGVRTWTNGYDLYAPSKSFAYHPYNRKKRPPLFWENRDDGRSKKSHNRIKKILGMKMNERELNNYDSTDIDRYGLGKKRSFAKYLKIFGIDIDNGEIYNHCAEAFAGILHDRLHAYLRPDKRGINYKYVYIPSDFKQEDQLIDGNENNNNENELNKPKKRKKNYLNLRERKESKKKIMKKQSSNLK